MSDEVTAEVPARWRVEGHFVPKGRYIDQDFARLELERIFGQAWQPACREEEVEGIGAYCEYVVGDQTIVVIRQEDGTLKAFHNACSHRGMKLVAGAGTIPEFRCRFHGWRFDIDGTNTFVHCRDEFDDRPDEQWGLRDLHCDTWGGWVFVSMAEDPEPLLEWLDPLPTALAPFRLEDMRFRWRRRVVLPVNWKNMVDAFVEGYHTPGTHPQTLRYHEGVRPSAAPCPVDEFAHAPYTPSIRYRNHGRFIYSARPPGHEGAPAEPRPMTASVYADTMEYQAVDVKSLATMRDVRAAAKLREMELAPEQYPNLVYQELVEQLAIEEGVDFPSMSMEEYFGGNGDWHIFPSLILLVEKSCTLGYRCLPNGDDPDSCVWEMFSLEHYSKDEEPSSKWQVFDHWRDCPDWGQLPTQDLKNLPDVQKGMHSDGFEGLWLNTAQEGAVLNHHLVADRFLFGVDHGDPMDPTNA